MSHGLDIVGSEFIATALFWKIEVIVRLYVEAILHFVEAGDVSFLILVLYFNQSFLAV